MKNAHVYPAHGWLPEGAHLEIQRDDQGKDIVTSWRGVIQSPGSGVCLSVLSDNPFPRGFGPAYPVIRIESGPFGGHDWYLGHTTSAVHPGERFRFGHVLAHADQGHNFNGTHGGWVELGEAPGGLPGPNAPTHWYDHLLETPLIVPIPFHPMHYGMSGRRIFVLTHRLAICGYLPHLRPRFDSLVRTAVIAFKEKHKIPMPPIAKQPRKQQDRGIVDQRTDEAIDKAARSCRKHHRKEFP